MQAGAALDQAIMLRETVYRLFSITAAQQPAPSSDVARLNAALAAAPGRTVVSSGGAISGWRVPPLECSATALLAPVLWSAADLLAGPRLARVHRCANPECGWLFLDNSKSGNRRWCDMGACGNRAKARRHYLRHKGGSPDPV
jgi:predicted RNA-binding Zn ribbon-like protein